MGKNTKFNSPLSIYSGGARLDADSMSQLILAASAQAAQGQGNILPSHARLLLDISPVSASKT